MIVSTPVSPLDEMNAGTAGIARVWSPHGARLTPYWYLIFLPNNYRQSSRNIEKCESQRSTLVASANYGD